MPHAGGTPRAWEENVLTKAPDEPPRRPATQPQDSVRPRTVVVYLILAALVLLPGVLLRLGFDSGMPALEPWFNSLREALLDIRFGSGLRFGLGVAGLVTMLLLIAYPIRKWLGSSGNVGRVGRWFHLHLILGIAAPVAIAYHTNFGLGATHANIALWSMIVVVASGIVGQFVYTTASVDFYRDKLRAREQVNAIIGVLNSLDAMHPSRSKLIADLEVFESELLTPRQGVLASISALWRMESRRRRLARELGWHLGAAAEQLRLDGAAHDDLRKTLALQLAAFASLARRGASRSIAEQVLARWRLLHLPVFVIMLVAAGLHVRNVWDMDALVLWRKPELAVRTSQPAPPPADAITLPVPPAPKPAARTSATAAAGDTAASEHKPVPKIEREPSPAAPLPRPSQPPKQATAEQYAPPAAPSPAQPPAAKPAMPTKIDLPRTLPEQIATYKAMQARGAFAHARAETGFALSGKHLKLDCANCHTAPLQGAPSLKPRECLDCHKEDDVHRGRRPKCAQCHTPNNWGEIVRRR